MVDLIYQDGDTYTSQFDRFAQAGATAALGDNLWRARILRFGDDMLTIGIALVLLGLRSFSGRRCARRWAYRG